MALPATALPATSPSVESLLQGFLDFALTFGVQATVLLGLCALFARALARGSARIEEGLWKTALIGSLVATCVILLTGFQPLGGRLSVTSAAALPSPSPPPPAAIARLPKATVQAEAEPILVALVPAELAAPGPANWGPKVAGVLAAGALFGLLRLLLEQRAFRRRLAHRRPLQTEEIGRPGALARLHQRLLVESGLEGRVALSASARLQSPIAFGIRSLEVCVPVRAIGDLEPEEQEAMLAHEVAHAAHRDPAWNTVLRVLRAVFWFQPLLILAERRLHVLFELRSDRRAAQLVEDPLALASCLTEVAGWIVPPVPKNVGAAAMASGRASLGARVDELLALTNDDLKTEDAPAWRTCNYSLGAVLLFGIAITAPAVEFEAPVASPLETLERGDAAGFESPALSAPAILIPANPLLAEIDLEFAAMRGELAELAALARTRSTPKIDARLRELELRLSSLYVSRGKLEALLETLPAPDHGSQTAPAPLNLEARAARDESNTP